MGIYFKLNFKSIFITFQKDGILNLSLENKKGRIDKSIILVVVVVVLVKIGKETMPCFRRSSAVQEFDFVVSAYSWVPQGDAS